MDRAKYPFNWEAISTNIRFGRAKGACENCGALHGYPHPITKSKVILTVHHLNFDTMDSDPLNLIALCQRCHLAADLNRHLETRRANAIAQQINAGQLTLSLPVPTKEQVATATPPAGRRSPPTVSPPCSEPVELRGHHVS